MSDELEDRQSQAQSNYPELQAFVNARKRPASHVVLTPYVNAL